MICHCKILCLKFATKPFNVLLACTHPLITEFADLICIFAMSIVEFSCLFCNTKISEFFDMAKSWAARLCRLPKQELFVAQVLKEFNL